MASISGKASAEYKAIQGNFSRLVTAVSSDVGTVAMKAFERNLISTNNMMDARNQMHSGNDRTTSLLVQILNRIEIDQSHFCTFVAVLQSLPVLNDVASDLMRQCQHTECSQCTSMPSPSPCPSLSLSQQVLQTDRAQSSAGYETMDAALAIASQITDKTFKTRRRCRTPTESQPIQQVLENQTKKGNKKRKVRNSKIIWFQCQCGKKCSLDTFVKGECLGQLEGEFPYLNTECLGEKAKERLIRTLICETNDIIRKFEDLTHEIFESLKKKKRSVVRLRKVALNFGGQLPKPYQEEHRTELSKITTIDDVQTFLLEHKFISFFNYRILEQITKSLGTANDKKKLHLYLKEYKEFCKRSVFKVPASVLDESKLDVEETVAMKVDEKVWFGANHKSPDSEFTMNDVYAIEAAIAEVIGDESTYILLRDIKKGCIELSFVILSAYEDLLFPTTLSQIEHLSSCGIIAVTHQEDEDSENVSQIELSANFEVSVLPADVEMTDTIVPQNQVNYEDTYEGKESEPIQFNHSQHESLSVLGITIIDRREEVTHEAASVGMRVAHSAAGSQAGYESHEELYSLSGRLSAMHLYDDKALTEKNLFKIVLYMRYLKDHDIIRLGQALGLLRLGMNYLPLRLPEDMADAWLNREDCVLETSGPPTWESLCRGLREIGQNGLANKIESEECDTSSKVKIPRGMPISIEEALHSGQILIIESVSLKALLPLASKWESIGVLLGIPRENIWRIRYNYYCTEDRLREMLAVWLHQENPVATWDALADAVEPFDFRKAEEIRQKYCV